MRRAPMLRVRGTEGTAIVRPGVLALGLETGCATKRAMTPNVEWMEETAALTIRTVGPHVQ